MDEKNEEVVIGGKKYIKIERGAPPREPGHEIPARAARPTGNDHITEVDAKFDELRVKEHFERVIRFAPDGAPPAKLEKVREALMKNMRIEPDPDKREGVVRAVRIIDQRLKEHDRMARARQEAQPKKTTSIENVRRLLFQRKQPPGERESKRPPRHGAP